MQTAAHTPTVSPPLQLTAKSNNLITICFIIGLILIIPIIFTFTAGIIGVRIQAITGFPLFLARNLILFPMGILGLIGLFAGAIGISQMKLNPDPRPYGIAITGFTLCFIGFAYMFFTWMGNLGNAIGYLATTGL